MMSSKDNNQGSKVNLARSSSKDTRLFNIPAAVILWGILILDLILLIFVIFLVATKGLGYTPSEKGKTEAEKVLERSSLTNPNAQGIPQQIPQK